MITSENADKIIPALFEVKKALRPMAKESRNPFFKSKYLELSDILVELEPILHDNGLMLSQSTEHRHDCEYVINRITHAASQQYVESEYKLGDLSDSQKRGGDVTYARRYGLKALLSLNEVDDDGNSASSKGKGPAKSADKPAAGGFNKPKEPVKASGFGGDKPKEPVKEPIKARAGSFGS